MKTAAKWFTGAISFLAALAIFSRLVTMPKGPQTIKAGADTLVHFFNGAFDQ